MSVKMNTKKASKDYPYRLILYNLNYKKYSISFHRKAIFLCQFIIRKHIFNEQIPDPSEQS